MEQRILIVDDEASILFAVSEYFTMRGYQVDRACTLDEAKALLGRGPSIIVADLRLTGSHRTEGLEIVSCVHSRHPSTRLVVLTAYGSPELEREARRRGVDAFLHKPTPLTEVARIISDLLRDPSASDVGTASPLDAAGSDQRDSTDGCSIAR